MWKPEHRVAAADRSGLRYPSDLIDAEWVIIEPMIPPAKHGGRKRTIDVREILNGIFYVLSTGCQWQALPKDLPPKSTAPRVACPGRGAGRLATRPRPPSAGGTAGRSYPASRRAEHSPRDGLRRSRLRHRQRQDRPRRDPVGPSWLTVMCDADNRIARWVGRLEEQMQPRSLCT
jgi:Putative transposase of IS4/5 family (DUF4096)